MKKFLIVVILLGSMAVSSYLVIKHLGSSRREARTHIQASPVITTEEGGNAPSPGGEVDFSTLPIIAEKTVALENGIKFKFGNFEGVENRYLSTTIWRSDGETWLRKYATTDLNFAIAQIFDVNRCHITWAPRVQNRKITLECEYPKDTPEPEVGRALLNVLGLAVSESEEEIELRKVYSRGTIKSLAKQGTNKSISYLPYATHASAKFGNFPLSEAFEIMFCEYGMEFTFANELSDVHVTFEITYTSPEEALEKLSDILNVSYEPTKKRVKTLYIYKPKE